MATAVVTKQISSFQSASIFSCALELAGFSSTRSLILVYLVNLHHIFLGHFLCDPGLLSHYKSSFCAAKTAKNWDNLDNA